MLLNAGDTVFLSLDLDPDRDATASTAGSSSVCSATPTTPRWA
jgi:hypothetical protein